MARARVPLPKVRMTVRSFLRAAALVAGALVATAPLASQDASAPPRLKLADVGLPGIDLGLSPSAQFDAIGGHARRPARAAAGRRPTSPAASW